MTTMTMTHAGTNGVSMIERIRSAFTRWNVARATRNELYRLSDRELNDIGLCRGDIDMIARQYA